MITSDTHIHTSYSPDANSKATFESYITEAKQRGFTSLTFTDHHDIDPAHPLFETPIQYDRYIKDFLKVKAKTGFNMKLGVELGYQKHVTNEMKAFLKRYPFEYVILSIHYVEKKDLFTQAYFHGKTQDEAYQIYFETCLEAVENFDEFHAFGHLDYIPRYAPFGDYEYKKYQDIIDKILKTLIKKDKFLEINTSGFLTEGRQYPKTEVINRYLELGGRKLSLGSDAHDTKDLGKFFDKIPENIKKCIVESR